MSVIDEDEAKKTQEALITMSQLEHEVGDFLGLNQKKKVGIMPTFYVLLQLLNRFILLLIFLIQIGILLVFHVLSQSLLQVL